MRGVREYVSIEDATTPRDGQVLTNRWWVVHPEHGVTFVKMTPKSRHRASQCNHDEAIVRHIAAQIHPGHGVQFIEAVYIGHQPEGEW
jgi:hypothetical protein